jgi:hypothetical protein
MSCAGLSPPALVNGSRGSDGANTRTRHQAKIEIKTASMMIPAAVNATSRFVRPSIATASWPSARAGPVGPLTPLGD